MKEGVIKTELTIIRSARRSVSLEVSGDGSVIVRCPLYFPEKECVRFAESKRAWIEKRLAEVNNDPKRRDFSPDEINDLKRRAKEYLVPKTKEYADRFGFSYTRVTITGAKMRFGSCSGKNAISFSCFLMLYPQPFIDYVVMHELCHTVHHDHSSRFYDLLGRCMPDFRSRKDLYRHNL